MRRLLLLAGALCATLPATACRDHPPSVPAGAVSDEAATSSDQASPAAATGSAAGAGQRGTTPLEITAKVGGKSYRASGLGECQHTTEASIYQVPAALWVARYSAGEESDLEHLNLTIWEPKAGGAAQVNLSLRVEGGEHQIATVQGGQLEGKGAGSVRRSGQGGTLTVEGESGEGAPVRVAVSCPAFTVPIAEGG
ncbi:MAG: hypothetical protein H0T68_04590 [Gemmatimonadales bacterium]|nr:hypothetical protein [Gemmatimonadales bacterium]